MIDLSKYLNQLVVIRYRNGEVNVVQIVESDNDVYLYKLGADLYMQDGSYQHNRISDLDILLLK